MSTLYIIASNRELSFVKELIKIRSREEEVGVLLIQDGVYAYLNFEEHPNVKIYVSKDDFLARGLKGDLNLVSYDDMVDLIFNYEKNVSWF
ncbi:MAG: DsrH/TusB family sulfur relay protein [Candidatus Hydrothermarchaeota archaeon]